MKRRQTTVNLDNETILHKVRLEDDASTPEQKEIRRYRLIETLFNSADLWQCGPSKFDKLVMSFENDRWIIETEFTEKRPTDHVSQTGSTR